VDRYLHCTLIDGKPFAILFNGLHEKHTSPMIIPRLIKKKFLNGKFFFI
jgi:hypothetical protein